MPSRHGNPEHEQPFDQHVRHERASVALGDPEEPAADPGPDLDRPAGCERVRQRRLLVDLHDHAIGYERALLRERRVEPRFLHRGRRDGGSDQHADDHEQDEAGSNDTSTTQLIGTSGILTGHPSGASGSSGTDLLTFDISSATGGQLATYAADIDLAIAAITTAGAKLGATKTNIDNQSTFVSALSDAITSGVGSLVDADMNVASTRLKALQTQQQLGIQSLSIANQNSQLILKLFG